MKMTVLFLPVVLAGACHYDWGVGPRPNDADSAVESGGVDATAIETGAPDGGLDAPVGEAAAGQCELYADTIHALSPGLLPCTKSCAQSVYDECGCTHPVEDADSGAAQRFSAAVATFTNAGCPPACQSGCNTVRYACLQLGDGGICI